MRERTADALIGQLAGKDRDARARPCVHCGVDTTYKKVCIGCGKPVLFVAKPKAPKVKQELESSIKARIRKALTDEGILCWVHNVDNRLLHTGLGLGTSDLICVVPPSGRFLGIEVKRPGKKSSDAQTRWLAVVRQFGGMSGVATSVEEALALVAAAKQSRGFDDGAPRT